MLVKVSVYKAKVSLESGRNLKEKNSNLICNNYLL